MLDTYVVMYEHAIMCLLVVSTELPAAESLSQAFDALTQLDAVINHVFTRIVQRVSA